MYVLALSSVSTDAGGGLHRPNSMRKSRIRARNGYLWVSSESRVLFFLIKLQTRVFYVYLQTRKGLLVISVYRQWSNQLTSICSSVKVFECLRNTIFLKWLKKHRHQLPHGFAQLFLQGMIERNIRHHSS